MKVIFFGTPEIAAPFLENLIKTSEVTGVVTRPDRPSDRGQKIHEPPAKTLALANNIPVFQPEKFTLNIIEKLIILKPDVNVVVSYGALIPEAVFNMPSYGSFNVHFSLLPKYRGAAPVQRALVNGEKETGVTTFRLEKTLDTGPVFVQKQIPIYDEDDTDSLFKKLTRLGIEAVGETIEILKVGNNPGVPQAGEPSYAPSLKKEEGRISWEKPARNIFNLIRGLKNWPCAYTIIDSGKLKGKRIKIIKASLIPQSAPASENGSITDVIKNKGFVVKCGKDLLLVEEVIPENKNSMSAWQFIQGSRLGAGDKLV